MCDTIDDVFKLLEDDSINLLKWFLDNQMKANSDKRHLITSKQSYMNLKLGNMNIANSTCGKLSGVKVDNKVNFNEHLDRIIKKASREVSALTRIFMNLTKRTIFNEFILQFTIQLLPSSGCVIVESLTGK